jgi:uncharacterized protein (TIGR03083 family)
MATNLDYVSHLAAESARFAEVIRDLTPDAKVPSCPDWSADDLLWHLAEVQWFWGTVVREKVTRAQAEQLKPGRPGGRAALADFYERASHDLHEILAATAPQAPAWTWSEDKTVGFIRRRQAHEALIHRIDAELAAGERSWMDPQLSSDGVDEVLRVMYGNLPAWGGFAPDDNAQAIRLQATDTTGSWLITPGRFTGTDPDDQTSYDEPAIHAADLDQGLTAAAEVSGSAADLDCWLWHRSSGTRLERSGDPRAIDRFESAIAPGID